jgi:hypothetical protein
MATDMTARFARDTANHQLEIRHDDGLYRHLRMRSTDHSMYWYDVITWPGSLCVRGDIGDDYVFTRLPDMLQFFRSRSGTINADYWAEKLPGGRRSVEEYSPDLMRRRIRDRVAEDIRGGAAPTGVGRAVTRDLLADPDLEDEESAFAAVAAWGYQGYWIDAEEWHPRDYSWSYLWACHAIVAAIAAYDQRAAGVPAGQLPLFDAQEA